MHATIYLYKKDVSSFDELLKRSCLRGQYPYLLIEEPSRVLTFPYRLYAQINAQTEPAWIADLVDFGSREWGAVNQYTSAVLLFSAADRFFAVSFGRGFQALETTLLEDEFGLRSCLSAMDTDQVRQITSKTIERDSRRRSTKFSAGVPLLGVGFEPGLESASELQGTIRDNPWARSVGGSTSLAVTGDFQISDLNHICSLMLGHFEDTTTEERFSWLLGHRPLSRTEIKRLNLLDRLLNEITDRSDALVISVPELSASLSPTIFELQCGRKRVAFSALDLAGIYRFLDEVGVAITDLQKVFVHVYDGDGNALSARRPLTDYIQGEWKADKSTFVHLNGAWFRLNSQYVARCRDLIKQIEDLSSHWQLPHVETSESEQSYNSRVATEKGWLLLDRNNFNLGANQRVEICDLLTPDCQLVCVKRMAASKSMSHLFAQGSVSAALFRNQPEYEQTLRAHFRKQWPKASFSSAPTIVYAIPSHKRGPLWRTLYGFSAIHLVGHVNRIRQHGLNVALCSVHEKKAVASELRKHRSLVQRRVA